MINKLQSRLILGRDTVIKVRGLGLESATHKLLTGSPAKDTYNEALALNNKIKDARMQYDIKDIIDQFFIGLARKLNKGINALKQEVLNSETLRQSLQISKLPEELLENYIQRIEEICSKNKVGNCEEQAFIAAKYLKDKGASKVAVISFKLPDSLKSKDFNDKFKRFCKFGDHAFVVCGIRRKANLQDPKTWGKSAVVIDPWLGMAGNAIKGMEEIRESLGIPEDHMKYIELKDYAHELLASHVSGDNKYSWEWWRQDKSRG